MVCLCGGRGCTDWIRGWRTDDGARGDPDDDLLPNLLEFATGRSPGVANASAVLSCETARNPVDGLDYLVVSYVRRSDAPWLGYVVEVSSDLDSWTSGPAVSEPAGPPVPLESGLSERVSVRVLPAIGSAPERRFVRLVVTTL
jgi:hypothetical protein